MTKATHKSFGLFRDHEAIAKLTQHIHETDSGSSSHWRAMHRQFRFKDGCIVAAVGFGGYQRRPRGAKRLAHRLLQRVYRRMGSAFRAFPDIDQVADAITARQDRAYDLDVLRQTITLALLMETVPEAFYNHRIVLVIGDGFGSLTSLMLSADKSIRIALINLTQTLLADLVMLRRGVPDAGVALVENAAALRTAFADPALRVVAIRADHQALLQEVPLALAVNIASMQEMRPDTIATYFDLMRRLPTAPLPFYCCNREEKHLPGGEISRFADYPWQSDDHVVIDEVCPWHQHFYTFRPPFYYPYHGPHRHRLAWLAPALPVAGTQR